MRQSLLLMVALAFCAGLSGTSLADTDTRTNTRYNFTTDSGSQWGRSSYGGVREVAFTGNYSAGTIIIRTSERKLYLVLGDGRARVYGVGVGRDGFQWSGSARISRKAEWPGWTPPAAMRRRQPELPAYMPGGPNNPLGARALYLGGTLYRIHGTNQAQTIGLAVSSGCIRMLNSEVIDLYGRVKVGTRVVVTR